MKAKMLIAVWGLLLVFVFALAPLATSAQAEPETVPAVAEEDALAEEEEVRQAGYIRQGNLLILMYHDFCLEPPEEKERIQLATTGEKFAADIDTLLDLGYLPISLEDYYFGQAETGQKYFTLTFDDGYAGVYDIAYPILVEKQVPGAVFFNTGMEHYPAFLHYQQLQEMEQSGFVKIYTHLAYHMKATELPMEDYTRYLDASVKFLNKYVGEKPMFLAYPYGDYNQEVYQVAREHGILMQFAQRMNFPAADIFVRVNVPYDADMKVLAAKTMHN